MANKNSNTENLFYSLPPSLVNELLGAEKQLMSAGNAAVKRVVVCREKIRETLAGSGLLGCVSSSVAAPDRPVAAVAGKKYSTNALDTVMACSAAVAVKNPGHGLADSHSDGTEYKIFIDSDSAFAESDVILSAIAAMMTAELSSHLDDIVLVRDSFISMFACVMEALPFAVKNKSTKTGGRFLAGLRDAIVAFDALVGGGGKAIRAGMPGEDRGGEFGKLFGNTVAIGQTTQLSIALDPGEYAGPVKCASGILETAANLSVKDQAFASLRDRIIEGLRNTQVLYFRPARWTPALRIEIPAPTAADMDSRTALLVSVGQQCAIPGYASPYQLQRAGRMADTIKTAVHAICMSALSGASAGMGDAQGVLFPFSAAGDSITGDDNG